MSLKEIAWCSSRGFLDSLKGLYWLYSLDLAQRRAHSDRQEFQELSRTKKRKPPISPQHSREEPRLLNRVIQCGTLNGFVFGLSIVLFNHVLLPLLQRLLSVLFLGSGSFWYWLHLLLKWTFDSLWVLPLFILSRVVNALWFQDIGTLAYRYSQGRPKGIGSLSTFIADNLFSFIIQALFLLQIATTPLSFISDGIFLLHMTLLYSLYSFEYKWVQMGWPLHQRLTFLETNWPYFVGFGLPLSLLTWWPGDFVISGCLFAIVFPVFIISGNEAEVAVSQWPTGSGRLKLFSPVVSLSNSLFKSRR